MSTAADALPTGWVKDDMPTIDEYTQLVASLEIDCHPFDSLAYSKAIRDRLELVEGPWQTVDDRTAAQRLVMQLEALQVLHGRLE